MSRPGLDVAPAGTRRHVAAAARPGSDRVGQKSNPSWHCDRLGSAVQVGSKGGEPVVDRPPSAGRCSAYVRGAFFAARRFTDLDDLNAHADDWCRGLAADRRCPGKPDRTVRDIFAEEVPRLLPLPDNPVPLLERVAVRRQEKVCARSQRAHTR
jgi:hypothetical protein